MIFLVWTQVLLSLQNNSIQFHSVTLKPVDSSCVSSVTLPGHRSDIRCVWSSLQSWACLGKTFHLWHFFQITHTQAVTLPPSTNNVGCIYPESSRLSLLYRVGCKIFSKKLHCFTKALRNYRKLWILHPCWVGLLSTIVILDREQY